MHQYQDLIRDVIDHGHDRPDRTGTGVRSVFGRQLRFDLQAGFPLVTTKAVPFKSVVAELLWFLAGRTDVQWLNDHHCTIWDEWADETGWLGPIYGAQWRAWAAPNGQYLDQMKALVEGIQTHPTSRRHVVTAWNPADLPDESVSPQENVRAGRMALAPCHCLMQFYVDDGTLSCQLYQRSADLFLGVPFNIASYALLTHLIAQQCDLHVGEFVHTFGDVHLYRNHMTEDIVYELLWREPKRLPRLEVYRRPSLFEYRPEDIRLNGYCPHPAIPAPISV